MKKILCIVETAYRATQEEQDDTVLWLAHALKNAGSEIGVLLRGNAVSYSVGGQDPTGIVIGKLPIEHPPYPEKDLLRMMMAGIPVHVVREDVEERGIPLDCLVKDFELIRNDQLPGLFTRYDQIWHW